jgi:hypothetical protein
MVTVIVYKDGRVVYSRVCPVCKRNECDHRCVGLLNVRHHVDDTCEGDDQQEA